MKIDFRADLHCHTACSDGSISPTQLIQLACARELQGLAITDHDTIDAYQEAMPVAQSHHLLLLSGVEFSAVQHKTSVHLLAYGFALQSDLIQTFCQKHKQRRIERTHAILERLRALNMPLSAEDFPSTSPGSLGRPHIAIAMVKKGYVTSIQQAFQNHIGEGKSCYVQGKSFSVEETLDIIHQAHGLAIIAHPHLIENPRILRDLLSMDFDGIEGYYARFPLTENERWLKIGANKGWIITGGSDFHGDIKPNLPLGCSWVNKETFQTLYQHFQRNQST